MRESINKLTVICLFLCILGVGGSALFADMIYLDKTTQGGGNKGTIGYRPVDEFGLAVSFLMTARTGIDIFRPDDAYASGSIGSIVIDGGRGDKGAGVQAADGSGSKGISGKPDDANEELIFTYDQAIRLDSLSVLLRDIDFGTGTGDKDDPIIFLSVAGTGTYGVTIQTSEIITAFTSTGGKEGTIDFGSFTSLPGYTQITGFKIRETNDHIAVLGVSDGAVPEPGTLSLLLIGSSLVMLKQKLT